MKTFDHPAPEALSLADVLDALGDPVRLSIVATLEKGQERSASDFNVDVCGSTLSHHLKVLRLAGVITHRKDGTRCFVALRPELDTSFPGLLDTVLRLAKKTGADAHATPGNEANPSASVVRKSSQ